MRQLLFSNNKLSDRTGLAPGTLTYVGEKRIQPSKLSIFSFNEQELSENSKANFDDLSSEAENSKVSWINVDGIHELDFVKKVGEIFRLHPLILEDIVNTTQRPKLEEYENGLYVVLKMISYEASEQEIDTEQISLFLGKGFVLTFQEKTADVLEPIRNRLRRSLGRLRKNKEDYLFYAILDVIIRNYFVVLEGIEDQINELEDWIYEDVSKEVIADIQSLKKALIFLRKSVLPLRELVNRVERNLENNFIQKKTLLFFRDLQDQISHSMDLIDTYRDILNNLHDLHISLNGHKMNQVMKVLTVVSTIFIPLTFIAGVYGMNFQNMPELTWENGYFFVLGIMAALAISLVFVFKKRSWL
ncbi:MAG: magnesium/cobalt transporter CorA [Bacteroidota bacterium]